MTTVAFDLSPEQVMLLGTSKRLGKAYDLEYWRAADREQCTPIKVWQENCSAGLAGAALPEQYGDNSLGMVELA